MDLECTGLDTVRLGRPDSLGLLLISNLQFAHGRVINSKKDGSQKYQKRIKTQTWSANTEQFNLPEIKFMRCLESKSGANDQFQRDMLHD